VPAHAWRQPLAEPAAGHQSRSGGSGGNPACSLGRGRKPSHNPSTLRPGWSRQLHQA